MTITSKNGSLIAALAVASVISSPMAVAVTVDLTAVGATYTAANGAIFTAESSSPTGTGVFNPFLRFQDNDGSEKGFNTDGRNPANTTFAFDAKSDPHTHSLATSSLENNGGYYTFILDLNEPGGANANVLLSTFDIYTSAIGNADVASIGGNVSNLGTKLFSLSGEVLLKDNFSGSGKSDVSIKIPVSFFAGANTYLTLYTEMSDNQGGFEEIAALTSTHNTPDTGSTIALLGLGVAGLVAARRKLEIGRASCRERV